MENINVGFKPIIYDDSEILILGSFPSVKSRQNNFYYGNPQNKFWNILAEIFGENKPIKINDKIEFCKKHKIALWDIVIESDLNGSSDLSLKHSKFKLADIESLIKLYPNIKTILCNGKLSYNLFNKYYKISLPCFYLPSTSPANTKLNKNEWKEKINTFLQ